MRTTESSGVSNIFVFLSGVAVGLLFAVKPGNEVREQIKDFFKNNRGRGSELLRKGKEQLESAKEKMTSEGGKEPFYESGKYT